MDSRRGKAEDIMRRKKRIIKMVSLIVASVLLTFFSTFYFFGVYEKNKIVAEYDKKLEEYKIDLSSSCYQLNKDVEKNSKVEKEDLKEVKIPRELKSKSLIVKMEKLDDSYYSEDLEKGSLLYKNMVYNYDGLESDLREYEVSSLILPTGIEIGDYIDVRISFPNGLDYVVLSKKKIRSINEIEEEKDGSLSTVYLNSEEILRLSSAMVDSYMNGEVKLYSTVYLDPQTQKASEVTYPNNSAVEEQMNIDANVLARIGKGGELKKVIGKNLKDDKITEENDASEESENEAENIEKIEGTVLENESAQSEENVEGNEEAIDGSSEEENLEISAADQKEEAANEETIEEIEMNLSDNIE